MMKKENKEKKFIKIPTYPGGSEALNNFINRNIKYPESAARKNIEGSVHLSFIVDHNGIVSSPKILKSLDIDCDAEAIRIVKLLKYNKTFNKGLKVRKTMKLRINFGRKNLGMQINYEYKITTKEEKPKDSNNDKKEVYGYTINF
ncbi:MAG: energy transducer TonB [Bacteroidetes bacterium]|jgi:TonB family protein|nr:energy transducer TonB [Bacteroidota bacterium]MBT6686687.1 energy transducer TonB [Bacteroidota bacterium]MBT7141825.1 energy transducer TonB [Bacteroidota bacterium]MBT7490684.1 energy transducer TonB [Bacteroidota bacterium]